MNLSKFTSIAIGTALLASTASAQMEFQSKRRSSTIGFSANGYEFKESPKFKDIDLGLSIMYWNGITNHLDYSVRYNGLFTNYMKNYPTNSNANYTQELEGSLHLKMLSDDHFINPFLTAGIGAGYYQQELEKKAFTAYAPVGVGVQFNFFSDFYLTLQGNYRFSFTDWVDNNYFYSVGVHSTLKYGPAKTVVPVAPKDTDRDGVPDDIDQCPELAGPAALNGCPDTDGDGVADKLDKCPTVFGLAKYDGCPIPDTDGDGVNDEEDKCPTVAGHPKYNGCPIPDTDGDGVNDELDKCPTLAGPASNQGCPEVKEEVKKRLSFAATAIQFETGKDVISKKSYAMLDEVAGIMNEYKDYNMHIGGHTDSTGSKEKNLTLSGLRAEAVKSYLVSKGISESRLFATGYGDTVPVADNKTKEGRAKNRRVELDLKLK